MIDKQDIIFEFKKSYSISYNKDFFCCVGGSVNLYDVKTGAHKFRITGLKQACFSLFSSDNRLFVKAAGGYFIYNLNTLYLEKRIHCPRGVRWGSYQFTLTPDNKYIIDFAEVSLNEKLIIIDVETGKSNLYEFGEGVTSSLFYDEYESNYLISTIIKKDNIITGPDSLCSNYYSFDFRSDNPEIKKMPFSLGYYYSIDYKNKTFALAGDKSDITIFDTESNKKECIKYIKDSVIHGIRISQNGKYIALAQSENIQIIDVAAKKVVKTFDVDYGCFADFYDNDTKLIIGMWEKGYCVDISSIINN